MRITKLELESFRNHAHSILNLGKASLVMVRGLNFSGKSSLRQALSMSLTPTTVGLDAQGRGFISKIRRGAAKAVITADIWWDGHLVERTVSLNTNTSGRTQRTISLSEPEWNPAPFDRQVEDMRAALTVALNTEAFLRMDEKEQKNLLAGLALPKRYDFDRRVTEAVDKALGPGAVNFEDEPFAVIQRAYKALYDERQIVNRQVKDFVIPEGLPSGHGDSASLQEELTTLRMTRRERESARNRALEGASAQTVERERRKTRLEVLEQGLIEDQRRAAALGASLTAPERLAALRRVVQGREELERASQEKKRVEAHLDTCLQEASRLEELDELAETSARCPTCEQAMDRAALAARTAKVAALIHTAKEQNQALYDQIARLGAVEEAAREIARSEAAQAEWTALEERIAQKQRLREQAEKEVPPPVLFDFAPYEQSLAEADAQIERLNAELRPMIAAEERQKEIAVKQEQLGRLTEKAALLNQLVKYFDKDGIKAKLLGEYIGGFERKLDEVLSAWGYGCALSIEPYSFMVSNARGDVIPVRELSGAEGVMFSLAFQCAVSRTANLGLVIIDEVAMFLPALRPAMNQRLYQMLESGFLEQVILLVADTSTQVPRLKGAKFFMVEEGTVRELRHQPGKEEA